MKSVLPGHARTPAGDRAEFGPKVAEHGGPAILRILNSRQPLVVLLGIMMPYMDGRAVLRAVAACPDVATRHRFILVTAATRDVIRDDLAQHMERLAIPYIQKPFTVEQILDAVAQAAGELRASETYAQLQGRDGVMLVRQHVRPEDGAGGDR